MVRGAAEAHLILRKELHPSGSALAVWSVGQPQAAPRTTPHTCLRSAAGAEQSSGSDLNSYKSKRLLKGGINMYDIHGPLRADQDARTLADRRAAGRELRNKVPRSSHAEW